MIGYGTADCANQSHPFVPHDASALDQDATPSPLPGNLDFYARDVEVDRLHRLHYMRPLAAEKPI